MQGENQNPVIQKDRQGDGLTNTDPVVLPKSSDGLNQAEKSDNNSNKPLYKPKKNKTKYVVSFLSVLFLAGGLIASVLLVQQQQEIREKAAGHCTPGVLQCSGYRQVSECISAGEECPTRVGKEVYSYPTWCEVVEECNTSEKCLEGICVDIQ